MEPYRVEPWIRELPEIEDQFCPMRLKGKRALQVIEVGALGAVAGRIFVRIEPRIAQVVFETTLGACRPDIRDS